MPDAARIGAHRYVLEPWPDALGLAALSWPLAIHGASAAIGPWTTTGTAIVLLLDAAMRYQHLQDHPEDLLGSFEWLARLPHRRP